MPEAPQGPKQPKRPQRQYLCVGRFAQFEWPKRPTLKSVCVGLFAKFLIAETPHAEIRVCVCVWAVSPSLRLNSFRSVRGLLRPICNLQSFAEKILAGFRKPGSLSFVPLPYVPEAPTIKNWETLTCVNPDLHIPYPALR